MQALPLPFFSLLDLILVNREIVLLHGFVQHQHENEFLLLLLLLLLLLDLFKM